MRDNKNSMIKELVSTFYRGLNNVSRVPGITLIMRRRHARILDGVIIDLIEFLSVFKAVGILSLDLVRWAV